MEEKILEILKKVLELDHIDKTCSQQNCPVWDSIHQLNLVVELEMEFDINIEPVEIADMQSFDKIVEVVKRNVEK